MVPLITRPDTTIRYGGDVVSAVLCQLGIEIAAFNPGSSFRGIHDSFVNFRPAPEVIECCHEEISVAIAHGYAKASGRPMAACVHNVVGLQHASMAIYNSWVDRVPVLVIGGTGPRDLTHRRPWIDWIHTALVQGQLVRDYVKWDDEPATLSSVPESLARAYRTAVIRPSGPVYVNFDVTIQEEQVPAGYRLPDLSRYKAAPNPAAPADDLRRLAAELARAERPVIVVERAEDPAAVAALAEALGAPVIDRGTRVGIANRHPLDLTGADAEVVAESDFVLGLDVDDMYGVLFKRAPNQGAPIPITTNRMRVAHIGLRELSLRAWSTEYHRLTEIDVPLIGDAGRAARELAEILARDVDPDRRAARTRAASARHEQLRRAWSEEAEARLSDAPLHPSALARILGEVVRGEDWCLANGSTHGWARRLWDFDQPYRYLGPSGGGGLGYGLGASVGAALALARGDRPKLVIDVQADGDMLFTPAALWTLAKYELPLLIVMDNNRTYFNSQNHAREVAEHRGRPSENWGIGTEITGPNVDFAALARSFGIWAEGPVERSQDLKPVLERALQVVKQGRPALVDVLTIPQPY